jgi:hypothetical protein
LGERHDWTKPLNWLLMKMAPAGMFELAWKVELAT